MARIHLRCAGLLSVLGLALAAAPARADQPDRSGGAVDETDADEHVVESKIHFDFDSTDLSPAARAELDKAAVWIEQNATGLILIEGHADKVGGAPYNKGLSERRAANAKKYLLAKGVEADRIRILPYGEGLPEKDTEQASRVNRRIVLLAVQKEPIVDTRVRTAIDRVEVPVPVERKVYIDRTVEIPVEVPVAVRVPTEPDMLGFDLMAGGGVTAFLADHTNDVTDAGGMWTARLVAGTGSLVGFEAAYVGSAQDIDSIGVDDNAVLLGTGVEGNLRINVMRRSLVQPFLFAGLGWTHYNVTNSDVATASIEERDDVLHVPAGVGVSFRLPRRVTVDVRGTYRGAADDGMFHGLDEGSEDDGLESLSTAAQLGFAF